MLSLQLVVSLILELFPSFIQIRHLAHSRPQGWRYPFDFCEIIVGGFRKQAGLLDCETRRLPLAPVSFSGFRPGTFFHLFLLHDG